MTLSRTWIAILVFALVVRLAAAWYWQDLLDRSDELLRFGDSQSYWTIAQRVANGEPYQYGSENSKIFRAPLYPCLLAPFTCFDAHQSPSRIGILLARGMGCLWGVLAVACIVSMTRRIADQRAMLVAGLLASIYPGAIGMSIFILSESIATPLFVLSVCLLRMACQAWSQSTAQVGSVARRFPAWFTLSFGAGAALGLACLARPSWSLWPAVALPYLLLACPPLRTERQRSLWMIATFVFAMAVVMSPWWIRNYAVTGKFVPTTLQVGASLYDGWHPGASGSSDENMDFVLGFVIDQQAEDALLANSGQPLESTLEWRIDQRMQKAALAWAWENPSDVVRLSLVKSAKTWNPLPVAREVSATVRWSEAAGYTVILLTAIVGMYRLRRVRGAWLFAMPCLYLAILHAIFIGSVRYRQPGVVLLCPLAAVGCMVILEWIRNSGQRTREPKPNDT